MTAATSERPDSETATLFADLPVAHPSSFAQWRALTGRVVWTMATKGELIVAFVTPLVFTLGFYLPLRFVMKFQGIDYAQFVMPVIVLQTMAFTMMSNAQLSAFEALTGLSTRLQTMPIGALVPLSARISAGLVRSCTSLTGALLFGHMIGFRFHAGWGQAALFCAFSLAVGTVLAIGADGLGSLTKSPESLSQALTLPTIIFGMLSCGFVPEANFPEWIRPFVRNQPISQFSFAMRDMAADGVSWQVLWVPLLWLGGLTIVFIPFAVWASVRRS
ncbi:ABC transporter permease [Nocardia bovistercoris]|uniref:ABC transporter permease n=1 Tax=Nocardia bovistercoris TaxID=2785916 RepID=A0A931IA42_9NOCA|nr:ABC transporter permease [Nocardia bovistercoris]MBH0777659.1 ABC transporter permease [Nocardia bovistercoris]